MQNISSTIDDVELVRLVTAGSVDDGKSTLIGRLLFDCHAVSKDQLIAVEKASKQKGMDDLDLSLITDGLSAEREQGITIDVAYRYFARPNRRFIIADVPGHEQYTRNMVTGASTADVAVLLVDARQGMLTQTKRHLSVAALLGISHIVILINKMDMVDYSRDRFVSIKKDIASFAAKLDIHDLQYIPLSALTGDMVVYRGDTMPWYQGPTVLSYLENVEVAPDRNMIDFRFPIQAVIRPNQDVRGYAGKVEGGFLLEGEEVVVLPSRIRTRVTRMYIGDTSVSQIFNQQSIVLTLENDVDLSRGDMLVRPNNIPLVGSTFQAMVCWLGSEPLDRTRSYICRHTTKSTRCTISQIQYQLDMDSLERKDATEFMLNDIGKVSIQTHEDIFVDTYKTNKNTGSFILIDDVSKETVAAGLFLREERQENIHSYVSSSVSEQDEHKNSKTHRIQINLGHMDMNTETDVRIRYIKLLREAGFHPLYIDDTLLNMLPCDDIFTHMPIWLDTLLQSASVDTIVHITRGKSGSTSHVLVQPRGSKKKHIVDIGEESALLPLIS